MKPSLSDVIVTEALKDCRSAFYSPFSFHKQRFQGTTIYLRSFEKHSQLNTWIIWVFSISLYTALILFIDSLILFLCRLKGLLPTPSDYPKSETLTVKNVLLEALDERNPVCRCYFHILTTVTSKPTSLIKSFAQSSIQLIKTKWNFHSDARQNLRVSNMNFLKKNQTFHRFPPQNRFKWYILLPHNLITGKKNPKTLTWRLIIGLIKQKTWFLTFQSSSGKGAAVAVGEAFHLRLVIDTAEFLNGAVCKD